MFFHINGLEVYEHQTPSKSIAKSARLTRIPARKRAISIADAVAFILLGVVIWRFVSLTGPDSVTSSGATAITITIGVIAIAIQLTRLIVKGNLNMMLLHRQLIADGMDRAHYVTEKHYSFKAILTEKMRHAMRNNPDAYSGVNSLLSNSKTIELDKNVDADAFMASDLSADHNAKLELIMMAERLSDGLGLDQADHFEALRSDELQMYSTRLSEAIEEAEEERRDLDRLAQLITIR